MSSVFSFVLKLSLLRSIDSRSLSDANVGDHSQGVAELSFSIFTGDLNKVKSLFESRIDVNIDLPDGKTPLMYAASADLGTREGLKNRVEIVKYLLTLNPDVDNRDTLGYCALTYALNSESDLGYEIAELLIEHGADVNGLASNSEPHLHYSIMMTNLVRIGFLLDHNADPNQRDAAGLCPLRYAFSSEQNGDFRIAKLLIDNGADVDGLDLSGLLTHLQSACYLEDVEAVRFLLNNGANPNILTTGNCTALDYVSRRTGDSQEIVQLLREHGAMSAQMLRAIEQGALLTKQAKHLRLKRHNATSSSKRERH